MLVANQGTLTTHKTHMLNIYKLIEDDALFDLQIQSPNCMLKLGPHTQIQLGYTYRPICRIQTL